MPRPPSARLKNNKVDAATLAQLLRADLLPEAWIAPPVTRQWRALLRHWTQLVRLRTRLRNRIHAVLADQGCDRAATYWSEAGQAWLNGLDLPQTSRELIADHLAVIDVVQQLVDRLDAELIAHATQDPRVPLLTALPGIGPLTAQIILAEVGDIHRFPTARKLASWAGLTPTVRGSDRTIRYGHISKQGDPWLRWLMCEAAQTVKRSPQFAACYQRITHRRGNKIATIAIARKLLTRAWHLLTEHETHTATPTAA